MRPIDFIICLPAHGAIIGAWFGAWPMPLDWERPWQVCNLDSVIFQYISQLPPEIVLEFSLSALKNVSALYVLFFGDYTISLVVRSSSYYGNDFCY